MINRLRAALKLARLLLHLAQGLWQVWRFFPTWHPLQKQQRIQAWAHILLALAAIKLEVHGRPPQDRATLLVSNHVSWLDVYVLMALCPCRFVAKSEVRQWPWVGKLALATGTLFISRRSPRDAMRVVHEMTAQLQAGQILAVFPEGTTSNGRQVLPFHANLFQAAIAAHAPVQPLALRYEDATSGQLSLAACYIDHDTLLQSLWRTLTAPALRVKVNFGQPELPMGRPRQHLAKALHDQVEQLANL
ncbi:lysophospholipid acyltransferase family protein [Rhodoferax sp.]|uniref:lysophospholipid acyltransferase family protein n=1 Tax=Rhodoferax sp. TaxID=50421 RepID=UPI002619DA15|nr:lysophospholipid acyltransferase family protein [Rhodoferax sp.]MDD5478300.1 lysophospholipid acyltransferase family protein [Rhodoferax sp.]